MLFRSGSAFRWETGASRALSPGSPTAARRDGVGLALVETSCKVSYERSSEYITGGQISKQTVMNKIRAASPRQKPTKYRAVEELHIDADEDHVSLQDGGSTIVPLISVYEGIEHHGRRGVCKNVFHISEYGKSPAALWEQGRWTSGCCPKNASSSSPDPTLAASPYA